MANMALSSVKDKTAIITGAGAGINFCFAKLLLTQGCNVLIADLGLRPESKALLDEYSKSPRAIFQETDVTDWTHLNRMFDTAEREFGTIDIVCPGAGVFEPLWSNFWHPPGASPSRDSPTGHRFASIDINITHPIRTTQLAISHFLAKGRPGYIVHISSIAAQTPGINVPIYVAAKHAISGFVRSMADLERPPNKSVPPIRVGAVAPGVVRTPLWLEHPEKRKWLDENVDEWVTPEEVAERMLEIITNKDYIGGTVVEVGAKGRARLVSNLNDPGPSGPGFTAAHRGSAGGEVFDELAKKGWGCGR